MTSLTHKTTYGVIWHLAQLISTKGITALVTLLLARFLVPADFGLVAMMTVFIAIANAVMDSGFMQALVRIKHADESDFNTAFYANLILGGASYFFLFLSAPLISDFYGEEKISILLRVAGLVVLINSFQIVQLSVLSRSLDFKTQFKATIPSSLLSASIAIYFAFLGYGVWALIAQMIVSSLITTILLWFQSSWRPSMVVSFVSLKTMYNFGYKLFLADLLEVIFKNLYVIVIAKLFTAAIAGLYFFAEKIIEVSVLQVITAIQSVTYPALMKKSDDQLSLKDSYKKLVIATTFILSPLILFLAVSSESLFRILLEQKWWAAVEYLQILCLISILIPVHALNLNILKVKGRSDWSLIIEVIKKFMTISILIFSMSYGVKGILLGQLMASIISLFINGYFSHRLINYSIGEQFCDFLPNIALAGTVAASMTYMGKIFPWGTATFLGVFVMLLTGGITYLILASLFSMSGYHIIKNVVFNSLLKRAQ